MPSDFLSGEKSGSAKPGGKPMWFSPTIELGHILQAGVMLLLVGGWAVVGYETIQKQIDQQSSELALYKQKLDSTVAAATDDRAIERSNQADIRQSLAKITDAIADMRAVIAAQGHDGHR